MLLRHKQKITDNIQKPAV